MKNFFFESILSENSSFNFYGSIHLEKFRFRTFILLINMQKNLNIGIYKKINYINFTSTFLFFTLNKYY